MQHFRLSVKIQQKHINLMEVQCFNEVSNNNTNNNNLEIVYSIIKCRADHEACYWSRGQEFVAFGVLVGQSNRPRVLVT